MSTHQQSVQNHNQDLVVFQVDLHQEDKLNLAYAEINQYHHFQVTCLKIKVQNNTESNHYTHSTSIESFWTKTYQSNADLPKRLFQMKNFKKLIEYFKDQKKRIIQTEEKLKSDKRKLLLNLYVPVTKNITDFVPLQLQYIDQDMIHYFFQAGKTAFQLIHKKILQILQQRKAKKKLQQQKKNIEQKMNQSEYQIIDNLEEGQMSSQFVNGSYHQYFTEEKSQQMRRYDNSQEKDEIQQYFQIDNDYFQADIENKTFYQECPQSNKILRDQYVQLMNQKNQLLLERILGLQCQLVKKNIQLQTYQDPFSDLNNIDQLIQKKCQTRIQRSYKAINSLMLMFHDLKKTVKSNSNSQVQSKDDTQEQQGQITPKKDINKIITQMQNVFEQFY